MTIAEWCIFGAVILYLGTIAPAKAIGHREFDNSLPRDPAFYDLPMRKRALGAHINGMETFPFFAASVLLAEFKSAPQVWIDVFAVAFLISRIAFVLVYVWDKATARTVLWNVANAFNVGIFFLSGFGVAGGLIATGAGLLWALALWPLLTSLKAAQKSATLQ
jgi:uncharacterized MAPEG superfamily protein